VSAGIVAIVPIDVVVLPGIQGKMACGASTTIEQKKPTMMRMAHAPTTRTVADVSPVRICNKLDPRYNGAQRYKQTARIWNIGIPSRSMVPF
jgi:hypothetical protein